MYVPAVVLFPVEICQPLSHHSSQLQPDKINNNNHTSTLPEGNTIAKIISTSQHLCSVHVLFAACYAAPTHLHESRVAFKGEEVHQGEDEAQLCIHGHLLDKHMHVPACAIRKCYTLCYKYILYW